MGVTTSLKPLARYSLCGARTGGVSSAPQRRTRGLQGWEGQELGGNWCEGWGAMGHSGVWCEGWEEMGAQGGLV